VVGRDTQDYLNIADGWLASGMYAEDLDDHEAAVACAGIAQAAATIALTLAAKETTT
jgi:hypothetical protein